MKLHARLTHTNHFVGGKGEGMFDGIVNFFKGDEGGGGGGKNIIILKAPAEYLSIDAAEKCSIFGKWRDAFF